MFFSLSKILWALLEPANVLVGLFVVGAVLVFWGRPRTVRWGKGVLGLAVVLTVLIAVLPFGRWMTLPLENRFAGPQTLPDDVAGIVVAGGVLDQFVTDSRGQPALNGAVERLFAMAELARRYPDAKLVYSAGSGRLGDQGLKEADFILPVLADLGIPPARVVLENQSRNTHENAVLSHRLVSPGADETWILVTSAFHMPRAVGAFRAAGWRIVPYPTDYTTLRDPGDGWRFSVWHGLHALSRGLHEWTGLTFYWLTGRIDSPFPAP